MKLKWNLTKMHSSNTNKVAMIWFIQKITRQWKISLLSKTLCLENQFNMIFGLMNIKIETFWLIFKQCASDLWFGLAPFTSLIDPPNSTFYCPSCPSRACIRGTSPVATRRRHLKYLFPNWVRDHTRTKSLFSTLWYRSNFCPKTRFWMGKIQNLLHKCTKNVFWTKYGLLGQCI